MRTLLLAVLAAVPMSHPAAQESRPQPPGKDAATRPQSSGWSGALDEKEFAALHELTAEKAPKAQGEMVQVGANRHYLSLPQGKPPFPALVVIHEFWGLNDHIKHWADRLAADGYAALAVDLYGGKVTTDRQEAAATMRAVGEKPEVALATLREAFAFLGDDPRVRASRRGCLGWCFGGAWSLQLAIHEPRLDAAVVYYGRLVTEPDQLAKIKAPLLGVFGNRDRSIPPAAVDAFERAMQEAGRDVRILRYDADHAFANPSGRNYDRENAARAWAEVRAFLAGKVKGAVPESTTTSPSKPDKR